MIGPVNKHDVIPTQRSGRGQSAESASDDDDPLASHKEKATLRGRTGGVNQAGSQEVALTPEGVAGFLWYDQPVTFLQPRRTKALNRIVVGIRVGPVPQHRAHVPSH